MNVAKKVTYALENPYEKRVEIAIFIIWLFMGSAMIGISLGFESFFVPKTPLNLMVQTALFFWIAQFKSWKSWLAIVAVFSIGIGIEWIGIHTSFPFGEYSYGENLGFKLDGVPYLIGANWLMLSWAAHSLLEKYQLNSYIKAVLAALVLVLFDLPMEVVAPKFDFWTFPSTAPWNNYFAWGMVAIVMQLIIQATKTRLAYGYALNYLLSQILFFTYFALVL